MNLLRLRAIRRVALLGCALALPCLALSSTGASATDGGGSTPIVCATGLPLGAATGYTEFVLGNGQRGAESEGAIAYGGNLPVNGMTVGTHLNVPSSYPALVVAGTGGSFNLQKGSAYVGNLTGYINFNGGGTRLATNPIDFSAAFADLRSRADRWVTATPNGTAEVVDSGATGTHLGGNVLWLQGTDPQLNVFSVTPAQLRDIRAVMIRVPTTATILINVAGAADVQIDGEVRYWNGSTYQQASDGMSSYVRRTLWNIPNAGTVKLYGGAAFGGSILAPRSHVHAVSIGHNLGQVIAASFQSNFETHQHLLYDDVCLPGDETPEQDADVAIVKTASKATAKPGDALTYTLKVTNHGPGTAKDVTVTDPIPPGVTFQSATAPCTYGGGIVTCSLGDLPKDATRTITITVTADPLPAPPPPAPSGKGGTPHLLTVGKVESQLDLDGGDEQEITLACPTGQILTDASIRVDHVDQDTGTLADVRVLAARTTGVGSWKALVRNDAEGRAQTKAFAVCLGKTTEEVDGHRHELKVSAPVTTTTTVPAGRTSITLACPTGSTPIVPGFVFDGDARLVASEPTSGGWRFDVAADEPTSVTVSMRCLDETTSTVKGHAHGLRLDHVVKQVTVPAGKVVEGQVTCADDAKGIVATFDVPPGLVDLGNDPRPKTRAFKLYNPTSGSLKATIDLICLGDRTLRKGGGGGGGEPTPVTVTNTATVTSADDPNPANDSSSATVTVSGSGGATVLGTPAVVYGSTLAVKTACPAGGGACAGTARVVVGGTVVASTSYRLKAGAERTLKLKLRGAAKRKVESARKVKATLKPKRGKASTKTIAVLH